MTPTYNRTTHLVRLAKGRVFPILGGVYGILGLLTFIRDNLLAPSVRNRWDTYGLLPHWSLSTWIAGALGFLVVVFFESSYRTEDSSLARIKELQASLEERAGAWVEYGDDFLLSNGARSAPVIHVQEVRRWFDDLMNEARAGDRIAAQRLLRACPKLDEISLQCFASGPGHVEDTERIRAAIAEFGGGG